MSGVQHVSRKGFQEGIDERRPISEKKTLTIAAAVTTAVTTADPRNHNLENLEQMLRCEICQNFMESPVTLISCSHTFCSLCIRKRISLQMVKGKASGHKTTCPKCQEPLNTKGRDYDKCFRPNRSLECMVIHFQDVLSKSESYQKKSLKRQSIESLSLEEREARTKKKPKTLYSSKNRREMVLLCQNEGLSAKGTEEQLKDRHRNFVMKFNANTDSFFPLSNAELVRFVNDEEAQTSMMKKRAKLSHSKSSKDPIAALSKSLKASKEDASVHITSGNAAFDKALKEGFRRLIDDLRRRTELEKKEKQKQSADAGKVHSPSQSHEPEVMDNCNRKSADPSVAVNPMKIAQQATATDASKVQSKGNHDDSKPGDKTEKESPQNMETTISNRQVASGDARPLESQANETHIILTPGVSSQPQPLIPREDVKTDGIELGATHMGLQSPQMSEMPRTLNQHSGVILSQSASKSNRKDLLGEGTSDFCDTKGYASMSHSVTKTAVAVSPSIVEQTSIPASPDVGATAPEGQKNIADSCFIRKENVSSRSRGKKNPAGSQNSSISSIGPWSCPTCTFWNTQRRWSRATCEMCETPRPAPKLSSQGYISID